MQALDKNQFERYSEFLFKKTGILVLANKKDLLQLKIQKVMNKLNIQSHDELLAMIMNNDKGEVIQEFINYATTNTTEFFREDAHFKYIKQYLPFIFKSNPRINNSKEIRVWSAASSTGQEPVTIAMVLKECLGEEFDIKILATDINSKVLSKAVKGIYSEDECLGVPKSYMFKYFTKLQDGFLLKDEILSLIKYRTFNLMDGFNFKKGFDIIFCRNVMIYFDENIQEQLINKFHNQLVPGGLLFIGQSESLLRKKHNYSYIGPSIYMK